VNRPGPSGCVSMGRHGVFRRPPLVSLFFRTVFARRYYLYRRMWCPVVEAFHKGIEVMQSKCCNRFPSAGQRQDTRVSEPIDTDAPWASLLQAECSLMLVVPVHWQLYKIPPNQLQFSGPPLISLLVGPVQSCGPSLLLCSLPFYQRAPKLKLSLAPFLIFPSSTLR
jgi:hypothetical protein